MILIATLGGLVSLVCWGFGDYFLGKSGKHSDAYLVNFLVQLIGTTILIPFVLFYGIPLQFDGTLFTIALVALSFTIAFVGAIKAFAIGPYGVATPIANSYPLATLAFGLIFLGFYISLSTLLVLLLIIGGILLLAVDRTTFDRKMFRGSVVYYALTAAIFWGIGFAFADTILRELPWLHFLFFINIFMTIFGLAYYVAVHRNFPTLGGLIRTSREYTWLATLLSLAGSATFFAASEYAGSVVIPAVIASAAPLVPSFLAHVRDKEILSTYKYLGAVLVIVGLMLLNIL